jgi:hypothetical protein
MVPSDSQLQWLARDLCLPTMDAAVWADEVFRSS